MNASVHWHTPSVAVTDPRGAAIRQVEYLRSVAGDPVQSLITRQRYNAAGHLIEQRDPRLSTPNEKTIHALGGQPLKVSNVDSGRRLILPGIDGQEVQRWDARDRHWLTDHDDRRRPISVAENGEVAETYTYAKGDADDGNNLRGQLIAFTDQSGAVTLDGYGLLGQPIDESRTFHDGKTFSHRQVFSALGVVLEHTDAAGHRQQSSYDVAGQLRQVQLQLANTTEWKPILVDAQLNAAGQIVEQQMGNGVSSRWLYDPADGRLLRQTAQKATGPALQDLEYGYDRVGNILRIFDHAYAPSWFSNQRVDGERAFTYDSLYRLLSASGYDDAAPVDNPGRPQPTDPNDRRNYLQSYEYDNGGNLIKTTHVRDGTSATREMYIDPDSNRGVRWKRGDPTPDFPALFDPAGNLQALQPGQPMQWNSHGELQSVTLLEHPGGGPNDTEHFRYSQGGRVFKRHETHTTKLSHFHDVHYLPHLDIHSKDNGEELHLISLFIGVGNVKCLHWAQGKPPGIDADQLRFSLTDHLGSCSMELDQQALLISQETYYADGQTASMTARSLIEVDYRFIRYSGKEMDRSGCYYFGARYYAPWLGRWISADPAGTGDGPNLYAFVRSNPLRYADDGGAQRTEAQQKQFITAQVKFLSTAQQNLYEAKKQFGDLTSPAAFRMKVLKNTVYLAGRAAAGFFSAYYATAAAFPPLLDGSPNPVPGEVQGLSVGNKVADRVSGYYATISAPFKLNDPILPVRSKLEPQSIRDQSLGKKTGLLESLTLQPTSTQDVAENIKQTTSFIVDTLGGALLPGVSELRELFHIAKDATTAEQLVTEYDLRVYDKLLDELEKTIDNVADSAEEAFNALSVEQFDAGNRDYLSDLASGTSIARTLHRDDIQKYRKSAVQSVQQVRATLARYRQYVAEQTVQRAA